MTTQSIDSYIFFQRQDALTLDQANYYQTLLYRTLKIGTELEFAMPKGVVREDYQPRIERLMQPSRDMNNLGTLGIYNVIKEHCGIELQIIGRHPQWSALLNQYQSIIKLLSVEQARIRSTCGLHFHVLAIGLSESIPEIIIANVWNICRRFAVGLKFITSAGQSKSCLCRRRQNNSHFEFVRQSPIQQSMATIQQNLKESFDVPEHQNFLNLEHLRFDDKENVSQFHLEFRFPDAELSAYSIVAKTFLFLAIVLKAVEISKFGLLHVGKFQDWAARKKLLDLLSNNDGTLSSSDTSKLSEEDWNTCTQDAVAMLKFLKSIFIIFDNPSEVILHDLARHPISFRLEAKMTWPAIDSRLASLITPAQQYDELDYRLFKIIELGLIENAASPEDWLKAAANKANVSKELIQGRMAAYNARQPLWDESMGRMVFLK